MEVSEPLGIIIHGIGEYILGDDKILYTSEEWLDKLGFSCNGFLNQDGTWSRYTEVLGKAHAGRAYDKDRDLWEINSNYLGFELKVKNATRRPALNKQMNTNPNCYSNEQYKKLGQACCLLMKKYPSIERKYIKGHSEVSGDDIRGKGKGKTDPGNMFDWVKLYGYIDLYNEKYKHE